MLAQAVVSRSDLRCEFANIAAAVALLSVAFAAIALFCFRPGTRDLTLIYVSLFCVFYAVRVLASLPSFRSLFDESPTFWNYLSWLVSSIIFFPGALYLYQVVGERLRTFLRWLLIARAVYAVFEIVAAALGVGLATLGLANNIKVLATLVATVIFLAVARSRPGLGASLSRDIPRSRRFVWVLFILHTNLVGLKVIRGAKRGGPGLPGVRRVSRIRVPRTAPSRTRNDSLAINKELEIARRIQSSTLPQCVPTLAGLEIAALRPMSAVAGDFYDFLSIDEKRVGVLIADVTGHGVPAALIASMLKIAFTSQADHAREPVRVLTGLNRSLCDKFDAHFVTAAYLSMSI